MKRALPIAILCILGSCSRTDIPDCTDDVGLCELADFTIGVAVSPAELKSNEVYRNIAVKQFDRFTPENIFKPEFLHPEQDAYVFDEAQALLVFASEHGMDVHGHTLIWHQQLPGWMAGYSGNRQDWIEMMRNHIQTVVSNLDVPSWDVVNEAFEDNGDFRNNIWHRHIGSEYIELAFRYAHEARPDALLFYNDYNIAAKPKKCRAIIEHLGALKADGVPVHGIGMQLHIDINSPSEKKIERATGAIVEEGFLVHYSEIDISLNPGGGDLNDVNLKLQKQGEFMKALVNLFQTIPEPQQFGITLWGVSDNNSWIPDYFNREDLPLLYNKEYEPKPMYCGFKDALVD